MKRKYLFQISTLFLLAVLTVSFTQKDDIVAALKTGSVEKMSKYFDNTVDVTVPGKSNSFSKGQAELVIKDFFSLNKVKNFELQHSGSNPSSNFIIGTLTTAGGTYRTTVYMRTKGDKQLIQGVEFEQKN
ncbi:MAG: DUF4783 domain-containing protein [Lacibacter sp.]|nr:DUF4783 domain-containing protein [Lacibacter sp.]